MKLSQYLKTKQNLIDKKLNTLIPDAEHFPQKIHQAMRYSIKGGKRIRPILCIASCEACGGGVISALLTSCAIEMLHTYSLIHDDLPSMDNSDYRRGKHTSHKKFDEATAVLNGDAFITLGYNVLSNATSNPKTNNRIINILSEATGTYGMIGGQVVDIATANLTIDLPLQEYINTHKTGALIAASCRVGAIIAKATKKNEEAIFRYGEYIGLAFQIIDDVLDDDGIVKIFGKKDAYQRAEALISKAKEQLRHFRKNKKPLMEIADFVLKRKK